MKNRNGYEVQYSESVPSQVRFWLEDAAKHNRRIRLFYGDTDRPDFERVHGRLPDAGKDWNEENDVTGYVGVSGGTNPIPLLLHNSKSTGGVGILIDCIVRMFVDGYEVYTHPEYHNKMDNAELKPSDMQPEYSTNIEVDGQIYARFRSLTSAKRYLAFMRGERMSK